LPDGKPVWRNPSGAILGHRFREFWVRQVRRRDVIKVMAGAAAAWPIAARAQPPDRARLIGVLLPIGKDDPEYQPWVAAFRAALQELGWVDGRTPPRFADKRRNWWHSRRTSFWRRARPR